MPMARFEGIAVNDLPQDTALLTLQTIVESSWIDYNGHMTEWQYYRLFADAGENFLRAYGFTEDYRLRGFSFFSVEGHQRNLRECRVDTALNVYTDMIAYDDVRLHIYQYIVDATSTICFATGEHMMLHVDTTLRRRTPIGEEMSSCAERALRLWAPPLRPKALFAQIRSVLEVPN